MVQRHIPLDCMGIRMTDMYAKMIEDGYIVVVGTGIGGTEITAEEYAEIMKAIDNSPTAPTGYEYKLRADNLEWELVELPPQPDPDAEDAPSYGDEL